MCLSKFPVKSSFWHTSALASTCSLKKWKCDPHAGDAYQAHCKASTVPCCRTCCPRVRPVRPTLRSRLSKPTRKNQKTKSMCDTDVCSWFSFWKLHGDWFHTMFHLSSSSYPLPYLSFSSPTLSLSLPVIPCHTLFSLSLSLSLVSQACSCATLRHCIGQGH